MEEQEILTLYFDRDEQAIAQTDRVYGPYCGHIAYGILRSRPDSEECVNDTWLRAWQAIPPTRPTCLQAWLGRVTRNLALDRCRREGAAKRGRRQISLCLEELGDCVSDTDCPDAQAEAREIAASVSAFLRRLGPTDRQLFLRRYWYLDSSRDLARHFKLKEGQVNTRLHRIRRRLKNHLEQEGLLP